MYNDVRKASEVHRAVRKYIKTIAVPGVKLIDMCETLENSVRALIEEKGLQVRGARGCGGRFGRGSSARLGSADACTGGLIQSHWPATGHGSAQRSGPPTGMHPFTPLGEPPVCRARGAARPRQRAHAPAAHFIRMGPQTPTPDPCRAPRHRAR